MTKIIICMNMSVNVTIHLITFSSNLIKEIHCSNAFLTLKSDQGHWNWYANIKVSGKAHYAKSEGFYWSLKEEANLGCWFCLFFSSVFSPSIQVLQVCTRSMCKQKEQKFSWLAFNWPDTNASAEGVRKGMCTTVSPHTCIYCHAYNCMVTCHSGSCTLTSETLILEFVSSSKMLQMNVMMTTFI